MKINLISMKKITLNFNSERHQNTIEFLNDRKEKKNIHNYLMQQIEEKNKEK